MQIAEIVLMIQTRKVKISDAKTTAVVIYVTTIVYVILLIIRFAFNGYQNTAAAFYATGFIATSYTVIVITFVQKVSKLY